MGGSERARAVAAVLLLAAWGVEVVAAAPESCAAVRNVYLRKGFRDNVPNQPISGDHLKMCRGASTCCTEVMERKLSIESRQEFDTSLKNLLNPMANLLAKKNAKFDELFRKLLNYSRKNFDDMFQKTYGILYKQNAFVFTGLYDNLENYYNSGKINLQDAMDAFFKELYQRMFTVFNSQYTFNAKYLRCVTRHMEELQPFGDVPQKLTTQIKRSFVALRTFVQGLATGRDVVRNVLKVNPSVSCVHELMRMTHCSTCDGHQGVRPCLPYCRDVINLCLAHHQPLITYWIAFVDAMVDVGERLENPFNIENVVEPVNFKVSDAIMNFQEAGHDISNKVFQGCGSPRLGRRKRAAVGRGELSQEFLDFSGGKREEKRESENFSISRHVHEIKTKIKNAHDFWDELPTKMCKDAVHQSATSCWTGTKLGKYEMKNMNVTEPYHSSDMDEQIMRLKVITSKLKEAYHGRNVSWIDDESWLGSGNKQDDDNDSEDEGSGSGWHSSGHYPPDDEDAYPGSGGGFDYENYNREGSGFKRTHVTNVGNRPSPFDPYKPAKPHTPPNHNIPSGVPDQPPSAAAKETMSLSRAITIYMLPAFIMFLGSLA
ncbi:glypican-4-like [Penaeus monodon]|uniref:glypican-4-like n=1 Tax=Penaeus monodon TaxID=6687 RepID=UPI0018A78C18|nr:glypican-4-like [Penaeus monodon]